ncbi:MAG: ATP-binding protein, partial [Bacteroidetes bacterium]|nr:ATP-binding protein [Bacteroidota bacterium]
MKSPFKFLDAYTPEDRDVFFGRDQEVETLYQLVFKSRLLLVYGQSGTGKTSLIQCGLGGKFDLTDWYPFHIRRNDDINRSLTEALSGPAGGKLRKDSFPETIAYIYKNFLRPVYLIFDQFEELFILGTPEEQEIFITSIQ